MSLAAGRLRHRVEIQEFTSVLDADGNRVDSWGAWNTVWAEVSPLSAREFVASAQVKSRVTARITIRWIDGLKASMRILHLGKIYNIEGVLPDVVSGTEYVTLPVSEGVSLG